MNINHLKQDRAAALDAAQAIMAKAESEKRTTLTAEEASAFDAHMAKAEELDATITRAERASKLAQPADKPNTEARGIHVEVHDRAEDAPFRSFGEFLQCVRTAACTPSAIDPRLQKRAALGANEAVGSEGGFLVGKDMSAEIYQEMHEVGVIAPKCQSVPISANSNGITINGVDETSRVDGSRWGGVQAYWGSEAGTPTASKPTFRQINLKLNKLFALYYATDEVLADAAALGSLAANAFAEEMAFKVDDALFRGLGAGQPLGILNAPVLVTVAKKTGQAANTFLWENAVDMYSRMPARSRARAAWYINQDVEPQLLTMSLPVGTGGAPVYLPPGGASGAPYGNLLGRPVIPIEFCSTLGTVGDVVLADWGSYLLATKGGLQQAESMHVQFLTGETTYRFTYRVDGQPARAKALTPFKGSNTLSPFVALATRA